jgi:hypothetical protein
MMMVLAPQKLAYAASRFKTWRETLEICGSGEHKSIQGLEYTGREPM